jgi:hypothetical protein
MDQVSIDAAEAMSGEEAFILQLRPPAPPGVDEGALADRIDQFTRLYLAAAAPHYARFAQLAPLTWAIAARVCDAEAVADLRASLCETLFGDDNPNHVQLARQPACEAEWAAPVSTSRRAAFDDGDAVFDMDAAALDIDDSDVFEVDAWRLPDPTISDHAPADALEAPGAEGAADDWTQAEPEASGLEDAGQSTAGPEADVLSALAELEQAFAANPAPSETAEAGAHDLDAEADHREDSAFDPAAFADELDAFEAAGAAAESHAAGLQSAPDPDQLTEAPAPRSSDVAAELSAFRAEMRAIAESIPGAGSSEALERFREEIDAVAGAVGQRVDGAAQRIEAAAERMVSAASPEASDRLIGAAERAEHSAALMEASVQEAVRALKAALDAAGPRNGAAAADG